MLSGGDRLRLVLFDIDGTLLRCGPQIRPLFAGALEEVFGTTGDLDRYSFAGKTDPRIVLDLLTASGLAGGEVEQRLERVRRAYLRRLDEGLEGERMRLLPGVLPLLERLAAQRDVALGLLTGNWEGGARIKLGRLGLNRFFAFGAFGDDGPDRRDLPPVALERARRHTGRSFRPQEVVIVGDTPHDVDCARAHGIRVLAVATGTVPAERLREAGADRVVESLEELGASEPPLWL